MIKCNNNWLWSALILFLFVGMFFPVVGSLALICMTAPVIYAYFKGGRKWCGCFCPRGNFLGKIISKASLKYKPPGFMSGKYFRYGVMFFLLGYFTFGVIKAWGNLSAVGLVFIRTVFTTTLLSVVLGIAFQPRTWCSLCPMGTLSTVVNNLKTTDKNKRCA